MAQLDGHTLYSPAEAAEQAWRLLPIPTLPAQPMVASLESELNLYTGLGDWLVTLDHADRVTLRLIQPGTVNHGIEIMAWIDSDRIAGETYFYWES